MRRVPGLAGRQAHAHPHRGDIDRVHNTDHTTAISIHVYGTDVTRIGSSARRYYD
jgi:hypothetical protein